MNISLFSGEGLLIPGDEVLRSDYTNALLVSCLIPGYRQYRHTPWVAPAVRIPLFVGK